MKKFSKKLFFRILSLILVVTLLCVLPQSIVLKNDNLELIYSKFLGEKSAHQGMIEIWNIDTFESGSISKKSLLNTAAESFQKKYKGIYVLVRNITKGECQNLLAGGNLPDMFSCSHELSSEIKKYIEPFENKNYEIYENFLAAGQDENFNQLALPWLSGLYFLLSTNKSIENAGRVVDDNFNLLENVYGLGYIKNNKKPKNIYSVTMPTIGNLLPQKALGAYNDSISQTNDLAVNNTKTFTQYDAYVEFLTGNSVMLLGSQRDVKRLFDRQNSGKIEGLITQPLVSYCDLVQFLFMSRTDSESKKCMLQKFAEYLTGQSFQSKLSTACLYSVSKNVNQQFSIDAFNVVSKKELENIKVQKCFSL